SIFIIACCVLAVITTFAQNNTSSAKKVIWHPAWLLRGNSGTNPSVNFIGTKDAQPLVFKINNKRAGLLDFDSTTGNTAFGYQSLISNTTGLANAAIGDYALYFHTTGLFNTANGWWALYANTEGYSNTAT